MYADDACIIAPSPSALYKLLGICTNFAQSNFVKFNESKTKCMCFKPKNQSCLYVSDTSMNNQVLSFVPSYRYLGVIANDKLDDDDDIMRHVKSLYARGNMLISRFRKCSDEVKTKLFKSFFSNVYCSQLWCVYRQSVYKKTIDCETASSPKFSVDEIRDAILNLKSGKSAGTDSLQSEHFKYADTKLCCVLLCCVVYFV